MNDDAFVNTAIDYAIKQFEKNKKSPDSPAFNTFLVVVIRLLVKIYGELDIVNPSKTKNENSLSGFDDNLTKYGYPHHLLENFKKQMLNYYNSVKQAEKSKKPIGKSIDFINIQKSLIDMMMYKMRKVDIKKKDSEDFYNLLYTEDNKNPNFKLVNLLMAEDLDAVRNYWVSANFKKDHEIIFEEVKQNVLDPKIYKAIGWSLEDVLGMSQEGINDLNARAFTQFEIDVNEEKALDKLNNAANDFFNRPKPLTSGSGYVDGLMIFSIMVTLSMVGFVLAVFFSK